MALNVKNKRLDNIDLRIKGIELYLEYYKLVFNINNRLKNDKASIKLNINNYINNSEIRLDYLNGKKISLWLGNIVNLKYYPSIKSYLGDLLLILKVKILYKRGI